MYSGHPVYNDHLAISQGWPLYTCLTVLVIVSKTNLSDYLHIKKCHSLTSRDFKGNLCRAVNPHITVIWPFPKGDRYIQVWLHSITVWLGCSYLEEKNDSMVSLMAKIAPFGSPSFFDRRECYMDNNFQELYSPLFNLKGHLMWELYPNRASSEKDPHHLKITDIAIKMRITTFFFLKR